MRRSFITLFLAAALVWALSCGGGGGSGGGSGFLGGLWSGAWTSTAGMGTGAIQATLSQSGTTVTGQGYIVVQGVRYDGSGTGTVTAADGPGQITLGMAFTQLGQSAVFKGNYTASTITGTYVMSAGDKGTFAVTKQ